MYEQVDKPKENKSRAVANSVAKKKSDVKQGFGFVDNRPSTTTQRKSLELTSSTLQEPHENRSMVIQKVKDPSGVKIDLEDSREAILTLTKSFESFHVASDSAEAQACARKRYAADNAVGTNTTAAYWDWAEAIMNAGQTLALGQNRINITLDYIDMAIVAGGGGISTMTPTKMNGEKTILVDLKQRDSPDFQSMYWELNLFHVH